MKILMWGRYDLFAVGGGDKVQIENTALELRNLGVDIDISTDINEDLSKYDLVHLFQLDWVPESYFFAKKAKDAGKTLILSPIHHKVEEVKRFDDEYAFGFRRIISLLAREQHARDTWKNIYRSVSHPSKIWPTLFSVFKGLKNMHSETLKMADTVLVQTELEAADLKRTYNVEFDWVKVPNGVGEHFVSYNGNDSPLGYSGYILCVGRIEARKNQLSVLEAVKKLNQEEDTDTTVVFVGKKSPHHKEYIGKFDKEISKHSWATYVAYTPYEDMPALYRNAKVGVSASWFESTGLTGLEALFSGCNVVAAGDRAKEMLRDFASYCDPGDIDSIKEAISEQYSKEFKEATEEMKNEYTWKNVAKLTKEVYERFVK